MGRVPLSRRNLLADRRRLTASVTGVGLAVMLILLLDGMWAGIRQQTTLYTDRAGANLYVLQPGVRDLTAGASTLPLASLNTVRADRGVDWAAPVRTTYLDLRAARHQGRRLRRRCRPGRAGRPVVDQQGPSRVR